MLADYDRATVDSSVAVARTAVLPELAQPVAVGWHSLCAAVHYVDKFRCRSVCWRQTSRPANEVHGGLEAMTELEQKLNALAKKYGVDLHRFREQYPVTP
jgi:hypothetical protein